MSNQIPDPETKKSAFSQAAEQAVHPLAVAGASVFIVGFLALVIVQQEFPEHWFVRTYLRGFRGVIAAVFLWIVVMATLFLLENTVVKRKARDESGNS